MTNPVIVLLDSLKSMVSRPDPSVKPRCSFCNKSQNEVAVLVAGPTVFICDECVGICVDMLQERANNAAQKSVVADTWLTEARASIAAARLLHESELYRQSALLSHGSVVALLKALLSMHEWRPETGDLEDILQQAYMLDSSLESPILNGEIEPHLLGWYYPPTVPVTEDSSQLHLDTAEHLLRHIEEQASQLLEAP